MQRQFWKIDPMIHAWKKKADFPIPQSSDGYDKPDLNVNVPILWTILNVSFVAKNVAIYIPLSIHINIWKDVHTLPKEYDFVGYFTVPKHFCFFSGVKSLFRLLWWW